jgi:deoxyribose-phosphate aldolase
MNIENIFNLIDLTLLDSAAPPDAIETLVFKGTQHHVAAFCVFPNHLDFIPESVTTRRATVVNFPSGNEPHPQVLQAIEHIASHHRIDEMDYVFPWQTYLNGDKTYALSCAAEAFELCKRHGLLFKVILETGALPSTDLIYQLSLDAINKGCDFLKTSTGKIHTGATLPAAKAMLSAILDSGKNCGIKLSGGIRSLEQAGSYIQLAEGMLNKPVSSSWFRLGTSSLLGNG